MSHSKRKGNDFVGFSTLVFIEKISLHERLPAYQISESEGA